MMFPSSSLSRFSSLVIPPPDGPPWLCSFKKFLGSSA
jgi:hypothetical protein